MDNRILKARLRKGVRIVMVPNGDEYFFIPRHYNEFFWKPQTFQKIIVNYKNGEFWFLIEWTYSHFCSRWIASIDDEFYEKFITKQMYETKSMNSCKNW